MLSCGKVIGQLSKITRHAYANNIYQPLKYVGIVSISNLRYSSDTKNRRPSGTTLKAEECVPGSQFTNAQKPPPFTGPPCEAKTDGSCPASCYTDCGVQNSQSGNSSKGDGPNNPFKYWKQILVALFVAGATVYTVKELKWLNIDEKVQQNTGKIGKKEKAKKRERKTIKLPPVSSHIPNEIPYLLIGGGTAAFSAFRSIKSRDPKAKVLVVSEESDLPYMRPPLSKELWYNSDREASAKLNFKQWNGTQRSLYYEPLEFYADVTSLTNSDKGGVAVARGWKVKKIDVVNKTAILEDDYEIKYDKCLIATGASPTSLPVLETAEDAVKRKMVPLRTTQDFLELEESVHDPNVKNIVIVGGGFLGSELACSLARNLNLEKKKIYQIYKEKSIMAQVLPEYLSEWTTRKTMMEGVNCIPNVEIQDYNFKNGKLSLILTNGQIIDADQVVVAVGVQANTQLATTSNLEVDPKVGGFLVNAELEARSNLWVAGDAACFYDVRLGRRRVEHHDHAVISGRLAGENMTGAGKPYLHQSMFWSDLGPDVGYEAIGIVDSSLPTVGVFVKATEDDTPLAAVTASNENIRSASEENAPAVKSKVLIETELVAQKISEPAEVLDDKNSQDKTNDKSCSESTAPPAPAKRDEFGKGVIFYLRDDVVVGIVLWNIFNRMSVARQVLARGTQYDDLNEVAKLFTIHED